MSQKWVDITDYSRDYGVSISTIRRRIKSGKLIVKKEGGKYWIEVISIESADQEPLILENKRLERQIKLLEQEVQELKMLIDIYEKKRPPSIPL